MRTGGFEPERPRGAETGERSDPAEAHFYAPRPIERSEMNPTPLGATLSALLVFPANECIAPEP